MAAVSIAVAVALPPASRLARRTRRSTTRTTSLPIFRNSCLGCHNPDKKKAGLDLSARWQTAITGSNNGQVINPGDPDGSAALRVVTHAEDPTMPPKKDKLPDKELDVIKMDPGGALETATGKPVVSKKPKVDLTFTARRRPKPPGPPPMPHDLVLEPFVHPRRPARWARWPPAPGRRSWRVGGQHQVLLYNPQTLCAAGRDPVPRGRAAGREVQPQRQLAARRRRAGRQEREGRALGRGHGQPRHRGGRRI